MPLPVQLPSLLYFLLVCCFDKLEQVFVGMSLRTYLEAAFRDGKAPLDPSTLVCSNLLEYLHIHLLLPLVGMLVFSELSPFAILVICVVEVLVVRTKCIELSTYLRCDCTLQRKIYMALL
jgi:hypothetical protein